MTVKELIEKLEQVENKDLHVRIWIDTFSDQTACGELSYFDFDGEHVSLGGEIDDFEANEELSIEPYGEDEGELEELLERAQAACDEHAIVSR